MPIEELLVESEVGLAHPLLNMALVGRIRGGRGILAGIGDIGIDDPVIEADDRGDHRGRRVSSGGEFEGAIVMANDVFQSHGAIVCAIFARLGPVVAKFAGKASPPDSQVCWVGSSG